MNNTPSSQQYTIQFNSMLLPAEKLSRASRRDKTTKKNWCGGRPEGPVRPLVLGRPGSEWQPGCGNYPRFGCHIFPDQASRRNWVGWAHFRPFSLYEGA